MMGPHEREVELYKLLITPKVAEDMFEAVAYVEIIQAFVRECPDYIDFHMWFLDNYGPVGRRDHPSIMWASVHHGFPEKVQ